MRRPLLDLSVRTRRGDAHVAPASRRLSALVRGPGGRFAEAIRTFVDDGSPDPEDAAVQHHLFVRALEGAGCEVLRLPPLPDHPDAPFVEDTGVVFGPVALTGRSAEPSRRGEEVAVAEALTDLGLDLWPLPEGATLDGGDVLRVGRRVFVGLSSRTNRRGAEAVSDLAHHVGLSPAVVPVHESLHLKTAVSGLDDETVIVNPCWLDLGLIPGLRVVRVPPAEPWAANVLDLGHAIVMADADEETAGLLEALGYRTIRTPLSQFRRAEAGPTCLTLLIRPTYPAA